MEQVDLNLAFRDFFRPLIPTASPLETMRAAGDEKLAVRQLNPLFIKNPVYKHFMMKLTFLGTKVKDWTAEVPENVDNSLVITDRILGLLGKDMVRNFVVAMGLSRAAGLNLTKKPEETSLNLNLKEIVGYGVAAQEYCNEKKLMHADMAFNAGVLFDGIAMILTKRKAPADQKNYVKETYEEGFLMAKVAYRIAQRMGRVEYDRYVFSGALAIASGKALMNVFFPKDLKEKSWSQLVADCEKHPKGKRDPMLAWEPKRFSTSHAELASIYASFTEHLRPVEKAILWYNTPYYLQALNKGMSTLASIWSLAALATSRTDNKYELEPHQEKFMKKNNLTLDVVKAVLAEVRAEKGK